jgi:DNA-binding transcriptional regulator GbsR (MarR family)
LSDFFLGQGSSRQEEEQFNQKRADQKHFVEEVGLLFEVAAMPRMAGRVFGWLLISNPPHQSPSELAQVLQASKGSISTMTQLLLEIGLIERLSLPGQRRDYFRIKLNAWSELTKRRMAQITAFRELAEQGLNLLEGNDPQLRLRLEEMRDTHAFWEQEIPLITERWEKQRLKHQLVSVAPFEPIAVTSPQSVSDRT